MVAAQAYEPHRHAGPCVLFNVRSRLSLQSNHLFTESIKASNTAAQVSRGPRIGIGHASGKQSPRPRSVNLRRSNEFWSDGSISPEGNAARARSIGEGGGGPFLPSFPCCLFQRGLGRPSVRPSVHSYLRCSFVPSCGRRPSHCLGSLAHRIISPSVHRHMHGVFKPILIIIQCCRATTLFTQIYTEYGKRGHA